ncbi:efflux RND transporter permease subunit [Neobacillus massiliamazoniensis]|uniref:AcrB/AcrD/AcrF family transporter n=1 Tax=Neobacillus massiliamazoniensis TaxID=1499688 RepID=A0A0U1NQW0_9BACI|nr:AcrB/AcrD/AcrF family transporter [Neobacillus massiliamazoniensis]
MNDIITEYPPKEAKEPSQHFHPRFPTNQALGMPALVGFLMLIGIVITNAIVLMERVKQNEKKGIEVKAALLKAGKTRLRPILMTAPATIGALLPLALSSEGGLISRSLAIVVISGLLTLLY